MVKKKKKVARKKTTAKKTVVPEMAEKKKCCGMGHCHMKLAVVAFVLIFLKLWPGALAWVGRTNVWWFVLALVIFLMKPMAKKRG